MTNTSTLQVLTLFISWLLSQHFESGCTPDGGFGCTLEGGFGCTPDGSCGRTPAAPAAPHKHKHTKGKTKRGTLEIIIILGTVFLALGMPTAAALTTYRLHTRRQLRLHH